MQKWIVVLGGLLIVQLVLALSLHLTDEDYAAFEPQEKLLAFDKEAVDGLRITDGDSSVVLNKQEGDWVLPESENFPADQAAVDRLLDQLAGLEKGWPVGATASALKRFKVADEAFEKKLTLLTDDQTQTVFYIGTSPGFRRVHVRPQDEEAVYAVSFNTWEAGVVTDDWIDKGILELDKSAVERIEMPDFVLQREGESFRVADLNDQEKIDTEAVDSLVDKLTGLQIQSLMDGEAKPDDLQAELEFEIKVTLQGDDVLTYRFFKPEDESSYVLKRSDFDHYFRVAEFMVNPVQEATREKLMRTPAEEAAGEAATQDASIEEAGSAME